MNRCIAVLSVLISLFISGLGLASAQDASPTANPAFADYPELTITITNDAFEVSSTDIPSGYLAMTVINQSDTESSAALLGPKEGETMDDLMQAAATPESSDSVPAFLYDAVILGGPQDILPGESATVLINVPAGDWATFGDGSQPPTFLTASETDESVSDAPDSDEQVEMADFEFNGLDGDVTGSGLWEITNTGEQPHMLVLTGVPEGTTEQQVLDAIMSEEGSSPVAEALNPEDLSFVSEGVLLLSSDQTMYLPVALDSGTYVAICFVNDPETGELHAMEGMITVFEVSGSSADATPQS
jgi:hypothetical protein